MIDFQINTLFKTFSSNSSKNKKPIWGVVHIPIWGNYEETFFTFFQKGLLSLPNRNFSKENGIVLLFSCPLSTKILIENHKDFSLLKTYYTVKFSVISTNFLQLVEKNFFPPCVKYFLLGCIQHRGLGYARVFSTSLLPLYADNIIDKEFFLKIDTIQRKGFECILSCCASIDLEKISSFVERKKISPANLSGQDIVDLQCRFLHELSKGRIVAPNKEISFSPQTFFLEDGALIIKSFTWSPIFIDKKLIKKWKKRWFHPIDNDTSFLVKNHQRKLFFIEDAKELGISEISGPRTKEYKKFIKNENLALLLFKESKRYRKKEYLFFFKKTVKCKPTFKLNLKYTEVNTRVLEKKFFQLFERKNK